MKRLLQIGGSLLLAAAILGVIYRDFDFHTVGQTLAQGLRWEWIAALTTAGIASQVLRALRWREALVSVGHDAHTPNLIYSTFIAFAASLVVPRIGELTRCATLSRTDSVPFGLSFGTIVAERIADSVILLIVGGTTLLWQSGRFGSLLHETGFDATQLVPHDTTGISVVISICLLIIGVAIYIARRRRGNGVLHRVLQDFKEGLFAVGRLRRPWLYVLYTVLICLANFLNLWLAFYAFAFTTHLGVAAGLLAFSMIAIAFVVPTPHGAGPWHFAIMMSLAAYGIPTDEAALFALILHSLQVMTIALLGIVGLMMIRRRRPRA